jgi:hypothetical protein
MVVMAIFLTVFASSPTQAAADTIYKTITYKQLFDIMRTKGYSVTLASSENDDVEPYSDDETIYWEIDGSTALIDVGDSNRRIEFYIYKTTENDNLIHLVNTWNEKHFFSRSHVDQDGDPVLELELDTTGGVTEANIAAFFKTCESSFTRWVSNVVD